MRRGTAVMQTSKTTRRVVASIALALGVLFAPQAMAVQAGARAAATTITVIDDHHTRVVLHGVPRRIVALAPNVVEILYALGAGHRVLGVSQDTDHPPAAAPKPLVAPYHGGAHLEKIVALRPDLPIPA